jgi:hypothetical protein
MGSFGVPFVRRAQREPESRIPDLLIHQGNAAADSAARSGQIWGGAVQQLGQQAAGAIQERAAVQQMAKRDAAFVRAVESWDGQDPKALLSSLKMFPPHEAVQMATGVVAFHGMTEKAEEQDFQNLLTLAPLIAKLPDAVLERWGPALQAKAGPIISKKFGVPPEQLQQPLAPAQIREFAQSLVPQKEGGDFTLGAGETRFGPDGKPIANVPKPPAEPKRHMVTVPGPDGKPTFRLATEEELAGGLTAYREPKAPADEPLVQVSVDGVATWVPRSQAAGKPAAQAARGATGQERTALGFYNRAQKASDDIAPLEEKIAKAGAASQLQLQHGANWMQTDEQQAYRQAQRSFTEARLRKESGAAIPDHEYANDARTYFAQPGDSKATLEQKRKARAVVLDGLRFGSGKAYDEYYGEPAPTPKNTPPAASTGPKRIKGDADYNALPSGAQFIGPDGKLRVKP